MEATQPEIRQRPFTGALAMALCALVLAFAAPASADAKLKVVTTTTDLKALVAEVGGNRVDATALCRGDQDPHYLQAKPSYMVAMSRADLVVSVGLELEIGWLPLLLRGSRNPKINAGRPGYLDASAAIKPIDIPSSVDRTEGDMHPNGNPHYWLDPENGRRLARLIETRLVTLDPEGKVAYEANLKDFEKRLDAAIARWKSTMDPLRGTKIASYHQTFNYFLKYYGIAGIGYVENRPGVPPSPSHLVSLIGEMKSHGVRVLLHENYFDRKASDLVAGKSSATVVVLPTSVDGATNTGSYIAFIDHLVTKFAAAVGGAK